MASTIKVKRSSTASAVPSSLSEGELAANTSDGKLFLGKNDSSVVEIGGGGGGGGGEVTTTLGENVSQNDPLVLYDDSGAKKTKKLSIYSGSDAYANVPDLSGLYASSDLTGNVSAVEQLDDNKWVVITKSYSIRIVTYDTVTSSYSFGTTFATNGNIIMDEYLTNIVVLSDSVFVVTGRQTAATAYAVAGLFSVSGTTISQVGSTLTLSSAQDGVNYMSCAYDGVVTSSYHHIFFGFYDTSDDTVYAGTLRVNTALTSMSTYNVTQVSADSDQFHGVSVVAGTGANDGTALIMYRDDVSNDEYLTAFEKSSSGYTSGTEYQTSYGYYGHQIGGYFDGSDYYHYWMDYSIGSGYVANINYLVVSSSGVYSDASSGDVLVGSGSEYGLKTPFYINGNVIEYATDKFLLVGESGENPSNLVAYTIERTGATSFSVNDSHYINSSGVNWDDTVFVATRTSGNFFVCSETGTSVYFSQISVDGSDVISGTIADPQPNFSHFWEVDTDKILGFAGSNLYALDTSANTSTAFPEPSNFNGGENNANVVKVDDPVNGTYYAFVWRHSNTNLVVAMLDFDNASISSTGYYTTITSVSDYFIAVEPSNKGFALLCINGTTAYVTTYRYATSTTFYESANEDIAREVVSQAQVVDSILAVSFDSNGGVCGVVEQGDVPIFFTTISPNWTFTAGGSHGSPISVKLQTLWETNYTLNNAFAIKSTDDFVDFVVLFSHSTSDVNARGLKGTVVRLQHDSASNVPYVFDTTPNQHFKVTGKIDGESLIQLGDSYATITDDYNNDQLHLIPDIWGNLRIAQVGAEFDTTVTLTTDYKKVVTADSPYQGYKLVSGFPVLNGSFIGFAKEAGTAGGTVTTVVPTGILGNASSLKAGLPVYLDLSTGTFSHDVSKKFFVGTALSSTQIMLE